MPELSAMEVLVAVAGAGAGSFNAAAGELRVSQQAVSSRIADWRVRPGSRWSLAPHAGRT
jgi:DNA-binding transcriptional LysR family regulator